MLPAQQQLVDKISNSLTVEHLAAKYQKWVESKTAKRSVTLIR